MVKKNSKVMIGMIILSLLLNVSDGLSWECIIAGVGAGAVAVVAAPFVLTAAGFTATGVAAGSLAAAVHAGIGNVAAGSAFAALQSAGAVGLAATTKIAIGSTVGVVVGTATCADKSIHC